MLKKILENNLVNLKPSEIDRYIYRIMPIHRLFEIFKSHEISLVSPEKWDDPFENLIIKNEIEKARNYFLNSNPTEEGVFNVFYSHKVAAQCWTLHKETDAMWRIYSQDTQGVKVKCSIRNLLKSLLESNPESVSNFLFLGKVKYLTKTNVLSFLQSNLYGITGLDSAKTLLIKRKEFKHESEVRLIYTYGNQKIKKLKIDPFDVFDEIVFDPRLNSNIYNAFSKSVIEAGFRKKVTKSLMYQL